MRNRRWFSTLPLLALSTLLLPGVRPAHADALTDQLTQIAAQQTATVPLNSWRFHQPDIAGGERAAFDDSAWQTVAPGVQWDGPNTNVWFRTHYTVPASVNGIATTGATLTLQVGMDDYAEVYVDGKFLERSHWDDGHVVIAQNARPGQTFSIAVRGVNEPGQGQLHFGRVVYDFLGSLQPGLGQYMREAQFTDQASGQIGSAEDRARLRETLTRSEAQVDLVALRSRDMAKAGASLDAAQKTLSAIAPITRQYDLYFVGHAHIDMNWLWTWPETVDVCHRTWDSAMNLMEKFPDFGFVQSQPGAYRAIQEQFPAEFARMQAKSKGQQWDTVGGLWDESDTNMPSGEGLARSLFLGQRYFKANFGHYAETGWLPDSFGHSWQMPQLLQEAGIRSYYHTRCGDGIRYAWWQSPDGSRVLKANTDSYDEPIAADQLLRPLGDEKQYGLKEALVVFGVGDHGGGPTRDMILTGKALQDDPLFPKVHFVTADAYFDHLFRNEKAQIADLPVVNTDLQYFAEGCYTTHADLKKAMRSSENNLYAAEVFASLASMTAGQPYPTADFAEAWRPTVFAQFHDIMCGSAIHSTYDWMHEQLKPAFAFEQAQTDRALNALTATVDTSGAKSEETPIVVWNALSKPRSDVVRVTFPGEAPFGFVRDAEGLLSPMQPIAPHTSVFVATRVPAFGHATYFLKTTPPIGKVSNNSPEVRETLDTIVMDNGNLKVTVSKSTGVITSLIDQKTRQEMIAPGQPANVLQVLRDSGNAWDLTLTGEKQELTTGADVQIVQNGPVCAVVRVKHTYGKSTFTQDITMYRNLPRLDIPTTVEWHEHGQTLKVAFPLNQQHPQARVAIPYGSISRPTNGHENPGQKWMDVTEVRQSPIANAAPLDLSTTFNHRSTADFDTENRGYAVALMPSAGIHKYGAASIPFALAAPGSKDNIACDGQTIALPAGTHADSLFLLGAAAPSPQRGALMFVRADGSQTRATFQMGDWVAGGGLDNESAFQLDSRHDPNGATDTGSKPHLWITHVNLPTDGAPVTQIVLPKNPNLHLFAMTVGASVAPTPLYGLTVLNDSKYGSDTNDNVFRLTLLRSPGDPDPNPDEGTQTFTYSLLPHEGDWRSAGAEQAGLALNIPLRAVITDAHTGKPATTRLTVAPSSVAVGALKHSEDGDGYIVRVYETFGRDAIAYINFGQSVRVEETDLLERPIRKRKIEVDGKGLVTFPIGHDQIVTLHVTGLPDAPTPQPPLSFR